MTGAPPHLSVMLDEALEGLALSSIGTYVDATYGNGGHSRAICERLSTGRLIGFDVDPSVEPFTHPAFHFVQANFRDVAEELHALGIGHIDGILFDFGVSSMQLDQAERGFSFQQAAPLDMRMDPGQGENAYELLARLPESELADILFHFGEERASRKIARALIRMREEGRLPATTVDLAACISSIVHRPGFRERIHPATRTFQALRIAVNQELSSIEQGLAAAIDLLNIGGRIVAISFHSLEDRIVKRRFRDDPRVKPITRKPLAPTGAEIHNNPRARSARLRIAERVEAS